MLQPTLQHRLINLAQSALLLGVMGLVAWVTVNALLGPDVALSVTIGSLIGLLLAPKLPRRILISAYNARPITEREAPELVAVVRELARRAGLPSAPELYYVPSELPNAFAMGTPDDGVICVTDGLLRLLDERELTGVLAHEVGHLVNRDLWIMGLADMMTRMVSFASWFGQLLLLVNLPLLLSGAAIVPWHVVLLMIFSPTLMALVQLGLSRTREYDADRVSAELTGDPDALISALLKLERRTGRFWEEMFLPGRRIPEPSLLRTHPPTEARVARLRALKREMLRGRPLPPPRDARKLPWAPEGPPRFHRWGTFW